MAEEVKIHEPKDDMAADMPARRGVNLSFFSLCTKVWADVGLSEVKLNGTLTLIELGEAR